MCYNASLSTYYVCVIRFGMSEKSFRNKVEPYLHCIANVLSLVGAFFLLVAKKYGSVGTHCYVPREPRIYRVIFGGIPFIICFIIVSVNMIVIVYSFIAQNRKSNKWGLKNRLNRHSYQNRKSRSDSYTSASPIMKPKDDGEKDPVAFDLKAMRAKAAKLNGETKVEGSSKSINPSRPTSKCEDSGLQTKDSCGRRRSTTFQSSLPSVSTNNNSRRLSMRNLSASFSSNYGSNEQLPRGLQKAARRNKRQKEVITQGLLYVGSFFLAFVFSTIYR